MSLSSKNICSCNGAGLESDSHTDTKRSSCSNILRPVAPTLRPEAHVAGLHKQPSSERFVWEVSEQAEDPQLRGRLGGSGRRAKAPEDVNEFMQVSDSEGTVTSLEPEGRGGELSSRLCHVEIGGWRQENRLSDKLGKGAQVLGSSLPSSSSSTYLFHCKPPPPSPVCCIKAQD